MARRRPLSSVCGPVTAGVLVAAAACGGALGDAPDGGGSARPTGAGSPPVPGARPGAPFDVEAFERIGTPYAEFLESGAGACDGGRCRLSYRFVTRPDRGSGCAVADVRYRPPERPDPQHPGRFLVQRGAAVMVVIACAPGVSPADAATLDGSTAGRTPEEGVPAVGTG